MKILKDYWPDMTAFLVGMLSFPATVLAIYLYTH